MLTLPSRSTDFNTFTASLKVAEGAFPRFQCILIGGLRVSASSDFQCRIWRLVVLTFNVQKKPFLGEKNSPLNAAIFAVEASAVAHPAASVAPNPHPFHRKTLHHRHTLQPRPSFKEAIRSPKRATYVCVCVV